jgi:hypothetical protein
MRRLTRGGAVFINDFYAGAIAVAAIILFAKFVTHGPRHKSGGFRGRFSKGLHYVCVAAALLAVSLSLAILGEVLVPKSSPVLFGWPKNAEGGVRAIVFWAVVSAAVILAIDVAWPSKPEPPVMATLPHDPSIR